MVPATVLITGTAGDRPRSGGLMGRGSGDNRRTMAVLRSAIDSASDAFATNASAMRALVGELRDRTADLTAGGAGGDEQSIERHRGRGKLPVRERVERLIDPGSAFLEASGLAATAMSGAGAARSGMGTGHWQ